MCVLDHRHTLIHYMAGYKSIWNHQVGFLFILHHNLNYNWNKKIKYHNFKTYIAGSELSLKPSLCLFFSKHKFKCKFNLLQFHVFPLFVVSEDCSHKTPHERYIGSAYAFWTFIWDTKHVTRMITCMLSRFLILCFWICAHAFPQEEKRGEKEETGFYTFCLE